MSGFGWEGWTTPYLRFPPIFLPWGPDVLGSGAVTGSHRLLQILLLTPPAIPEVFPMCSGGGSRLSLPVVPWTFGLGVRPRVRWALIEGVVHVAWVWNPISSERVRRMTSQRLGWCYLVSVTGFLPCAPSGSSGASRYRCGMLRSISGSPSSHHSLPRQDPKPPCQVNRRQPPLSLQNARLAPLPPPNRPFT